MQTLNEIGLKYKTDKNSLIHDYLHIYDKYFSEFRDKEISILEIGILGGESLRMWSEYFHKANIFAIDIDANQLINADKIKSFCANQEKREDLKGVMDKMQEKPSIIIDDGGHTMKQQQISLGFLFPYLKPFGYYVIEDLHTSYIRQRRFNNPHTEETTLKIVNSLKNCNEIKSDYILQEESLYIQSHLYNCDVTKARKSEIAFIRKKSDGN